MKTITFRGSQELSHSSYNLCMGIALLWGFLLNWWMVASIPSAAVAGISPWLILIGYLVSAFAGSFIMAASQTPVWSFVGYNLIAAPIGIILVLVLPGYSSEVITQALQTTVVVTCAMMFLATAFPRFFLSIGSALFWGLLIALVAQLIMVFAFKAHLGVMDWIIAIIFCGYIGYDWARASSRPKNLNNAVLSAGNLYLSIINLFMRTLSLINPKS